VRSLAFGSHRASSFQRRLVRSLAFGSHRASSDPRRLVGSLACGSHRASSDPRESRIDRPGKIAVVGRALLLPSRGIRPVCE
jgi:hypothetical protein